ncbi:MAG TPA: ABC transporter substrate-binding protein [Spirochaetia bacterium]|nr:ABC transporter substrate-binding protein [Spirochaetia bacterium]
MKRAFFILVLGAALIGGAAWAGGSSESASTPAGPVDVTFWHSMSGDLGGTAIPKMVKDFNDSQSKYVVKATYQGPYDDALNKLKAGLQSGNIPSVAQMYDIGTQLMIDLKSVTPVQTFIDKEKYDVSGLEPNVLSYYTVGGKLWSMPFNSSDPILYYNKDMFKAAGLDPNKPPRTFAEFADDAKALTTKDASGTVTTYGGAFAIYGWFFEQYLAVSAGYYVNNENGRAARATAAAFNSPQGVAILTWWKQMIDQGILGNFGRQTVDVRNAFLAGKTAMIIDSTAVLRGLINASQGKFELGTGFLPRPNDAAYKTGGTVIGGGSLWIMNGRPSPEQQGAWEFIKFLNAPAQQAYWHTMSGYFPLSKAAYDLPLDKEWRAKYPQFQTAIDQLHAAPVNAYTQGGLIGVFPMARQTIEGAIEAVVAGKATPQAALDTAAATVTKAIQDYERTVAK